MPIRHWKIITYIVIMLLLGSCAPNAQGTATPTTVPVIVRQDKPTYTVQRGDIQARVNLTGNINVGSQQDLAFRTGGRVKQIYVKLGDQVTQGQLLAELQALNQSQLAQQKNALEVKRKQVQLELAQLKLAAFKAQPLTVSQIKYDLPILEYEVELAQIGLEEAKLLSGNLNQQVEDFQIIAPNDGTVVWLNITEGNEVAEFDAAITIADMNHLVIQIQPNQDVANYLTEGMPVTYHVKSVGGKTYEGKITSLPSSPGLEQTTVNAFQIKIDSIPDGGTLFGFIEVSIVLADRKATLWLPPQVIRVFEGQDYVITKDKDIQHRVDIQTGLRTVDKVEILAGLEEGDLVIAP